MHHKKKRNLRLTNGAGREGRGLLGKGWPLLVAQKLIICQTLVADSVNYCLRHPRQRFSYVLSVPKEFFSSGYKELRGRPPRHAFVHQKPIGPALSRRGHRPCALCDKHLLALLAGHTACKNAGPCALNALRASSMTHLTMFTN